MKSPAYSVAQLLESEGLGTIAGNAGWSIAVAAEPASPDTTITVYDTGGIEPDTDQLDRRPSFQVRVRAHNYIAASDKINEVIDALHAQSGVELNGTRFSSFEMLSDVVSLGKDDNERFILTVNFRVPNAEDVA